MQDSGEAATYFLETGGVLSESGAAATGFYADELDVGVGEEFIEGADGVRAASDAGYDGGGSLPSCSRICWRASRLMTR